MTEETVEEMTIEELIKHPYMALYQANTEDFSTEAYFKAEILSNNTCEETKVGASIRAKLRDSLELIADEGALIVGEQTLALASMRLSGVGGRVDIVGGWKLLHKTCTEADSYWRYLAHSRGNYFYYVGLGCVKSYYFAYCHLLSAFEYQKSVSTEGVDMTKRAIKRLERKMTTISIEKAQEQVKKLFEVPNMFA